MVLSLGVICVMLKYKSMSIFSYLRILWSILFPGSIYLGTLSLPCLHYIIDYAICNTMMQSRSSMYNLTSIQTSRIVSKCYPAC